MQNSTTKKIILVTLTVMMICVVNAQNGWVLKKQEDGIKIYTRTQSNSKIKAIKVECIFNATLSQLAAVIFDINTNHQWVYRTKNYTVVKKNHPFDLYYYAEVETPWPVSNRDFIAHLKLSQNPVSRVMVVEAENAPYLLPQKQDIVRIMHSIGKWVVTVQNQTSIKAEYTLFTDPGGNVPSWLMNMFIADGPLESFQKLKEHLKKPVYANISLPGIRNF